MICFADERLMQRETEAICNAAPGERSADRGNQRNCYRDRGWETRAGTVELRIVSVAINFAVGMNSDAQREVLGMTTDRSDAEPFWIKFPRGLPRRGLRLMIKMVISGAHEGLKAAITKILTATWQGCRVHFMRNALSYAGKTQKRVVSAWVGTAFAPDDVTPACKQRRDVADQMRPRLPKLVGLLDETKNDVLAYIDFPTPHRQNPLDQPAGAVQRRDQRSADVVGIFPNDAAAMGLIAALLLEQNDEWARHHARYMTLETIMPLAILRLSECQKWIADRAANAAHNTAPRLHSETRTNLCCT